MYLEVDGSLVKEWADGLLRVQVLGVLSADDG